MKHPSVFVTERASSTGQYQWRAQIWWEGNGGIYRDFEKQADAYAWVGKKLREHEA